MAPSEENLREEFSQFLGDAVGLNVNALCGDASSRSYFRITHSKGSHILQVDPDSSASMEDGEHPFLSARQLFESLVGQVPSFRGRSAKKKWILLEDLGDRTLQDEPTEARYGEAIDLIVRIVVEFERNKGASKLTEEYEGPHLGWAFDEKKLGAEMEHTAKHLIEFYCQADPAEFLKLVQPTVSFLAKRPRFLVHRDFHSRNLMLHHDRLWVIDFQDARMGPLTYDVVSLLWDPYTQLDRELRGRLLERWRAALKMASSESVLTERIANALEGEAHVEELERIKVQRMLKAAGSYAGFLNLKGRKDYLPSIKPALQEAHAALASLQQRGLLQGEDAKLLTFLASLKAEGSVILD